uniref:Transmembrane protein 231 n=1 Tax=Tetraselmis chuii TaxID=63592 RepID=A0A6U1ERU7_9CHLO|mmetsp:Transcript_16006/g.28471  ORF Transcript_16006/g.28471 Transcript_16006/m.28471 type:complete len:314 (+) Transcript_16006:290-1231(+)
MVQIYQEKLVLRHYAHLLSIASWLRLLGLLGALVLSYTIAFTTGGFWLKTNTVYEQPRVSFGYGMIVVLEGAMPGEELLWSSLPSLRESYGAKLASVTAEAVEYDDNYDGKADLITVTASARGVGMHVHSIKVVMDFQYHLRDALRMHLAPLVYVTHASPIPGAAFYSFGELALEQRDPLQSRTRRQTYNETLLLDPSQRNSSVPALHDYSLQAILSANMARNESAMYSNMQPVWLSGNSGDFTMEFKFRIPSNQGVVIRRRQAEMVKFAWVQFLGVFIIFWWIFRWAEWVVFHFRIVPTRVLSDIERKPHRF